MSGSLLVATKTWKDTCVVPCWEQVNFASPMTLAAHTTYFAAYYTLTADCSADKFSDEWVIRLDSSRPRQAARSAAMASALMRQLP
jgi:hypothetical protein